mmetsp:Transcript_29916/g.81063  ORF Transcript_29916/g.81063 Transcript_29916/m.81063 type:complete len:350 (-) Transcript_29916:691-1740(-)
MRRLPCLTCGAAANARRPLLLLPCACTCWLLSRRGWGWPFGTEGRLSVASAASANCTGLAPPVAGPAGGLAKERRAEGPGAAATAAGCGGTAAGALGASGSVPVGGGEATTAAAATAAATVGSVPAADALREGTLSGGGSGGSSARGGGEDDAVRGVMGVVRERRGPATERRCWAGVCGPSPSRSQFQAPSSAFRTASTAALTSGSACGAAPSSPSETSACMPSRHSSSSAAMYLSKEMESAEPPAVPSTTESRWISEMIWPTSRSLGVWTSFCIMMTVQNLRTIVSASLCCMFHWPRRTAGTLGPTQWTKTYFTQSVSLLLPLPNEKRMTPKRTLSSSSHAFSSSRPP